MHAGGAVRADSRAELERHAAHGQPPARHREQPALASAAEADHVAVALDIEHLADADDRGRGRDQVRAVDREAHGAARGHSSRKSDGAQEVSVLSARADVAPPSATASASAVAVVVLGIRRAHDPRMAGTRKCSFAVVIA